MKHGIRDFGATRLAENLRQNFTLTHLNLSWYFVVHKLFSQRCRIGTPSLLFRPSRKNGCIYSYTVQCSMLTVSIAASQASRDMPSSQNSNARWIREMFSAQSLK
jgi:hypothetical protein